MSSVAALYSLVNHHFAVPTWNGSKEEEPPIVMSPFICPIIYELHIKKGRGKFDLKSRELLPQRPQGQSLWVAGSDGPPYFPESVP